MELKVKGIRTMQGTDGGAFNATLYVDGVKTAFAIDEGCGGEVRFHVFNKEKWSLFNAHVASLPKVESNGLTLTKDAGWVVTDLVNEELDRRDLKRRCKNRTLFTRKGKEGVWSISRPFSDEVEAYLRKKYDDLDRILNKDVA